MRKILFRGKCKSDGAWVYGYYARDEMRNHYITEHGRYNVVVPETVGQYTGMTDKNGREMYEGDVVYWSRIRWCIEWRGCGYVMSIIDGGPNDVVSLYNHCGDVTVVGNVHDDRELMEVQQ